MKITYQRFPDKKEYQSLLIINEDKRWGESLFFTYYTPWGEDEKTMYAGRYQSGTHFKNKECESVLAFDFHNWDKSSIGEALEQELPDVIFKTPLKDLLERALEERDKTPDGFTLKVKK